MMDEQLFVVTPTFAPEKIGTPHYVTDLVRALVDAGVDVTVVTNQPYYPAFERFEGYGRSARRQALAGATVYRLPTIVPRRGALAWRALSELNFVLQVAILRLRGHVRRQEKVVAVSPGVPFAVVAARLLCRPNGRVVAVVHDIQTGLISNRYVRWAAGHVERWALERAHHLTALSDGMRAALLSLGVRRPIDVDPLWATVTAREDVSVEPGLILYSGNLGRKQGVHHLLDLASRLETIAPTADLVIRGEGSERRSLEAASARQKHRNVRFDDLVEEHELARSLASAAVHVIPQLPDGATASMPSKVLNILAVGRPVVAYASPQSGLADLADRLDAVVRVEPGDEVGFARAVADALHMSDEKRERVGRQARDFVAREHSRESAASTLWARIEGTGTPAHGDTGDVP
jgi:colanic acid biosynthesis glycosyl transferase WcaI